MTVHPCSIDSIWLVYEMNFSAHDREWKINRILDGLTLYRLPGGRSPNFKSPIECLKRVWSTLWSTTMTLENLGVNDLRSIRPVLNSFAGSSSSFLMNWRWRRSGRSMMKFYYQGRGLARTSWENYIFNFHKQRETQSGHQRYMQLASGVKSLKQKTLRQNSKSM